MATQGLATKFNVAPALSVPFQTIAATGATATVGAYFDAIPYPLDAFWFEVKVVAIYEDGSKAAAYWLAGLFRSDADGVVTQVGSTASVITAIEDTGSMDCTLAVGAPADSGSGTSTDDTQIQVTVTGVAATTINWLFDNTIRHAPFSQ